MGMVRSSVHRRDDTLDLVQVVPKVDKIILIQGVRTWDQGARVSARRANREPEDGIRWKFVHGRVVVVR